MDLAIALKSALLGLLEGLTEFLPISSTGHLIIFSDLLDFSHVPFYTAFLIVIQLGSILAVMWAYRARISRMMSGVINNQPTERKFAKNILLGFLPAMLIGPLLAETVEQALLNPIIVAFMLVFGGVILIYAERRTHKVRVDSMEALSIKDALVVGLCQCLAMVPGTSRSGATIVGGLLYGLSRKTATEFSFFLAMPTMIGASVYSLIKFWDHLTANGIAAIALAFVISFLVALMTVRLLLNFISRYTYVGFGIYRIVFGVVILLSWHFGWVNWAV